MIDRQECFGFGNASASRLLVYGWPLASIFLRFLLPSTALNAFGQIPVKKDFRAASGYTFLAPVTSPFSYLIDNDGTVVHRRPGSGNAAQAVYLLPNGNILRTGTLLSMAFATGAGSGGRLDELNWQGELVWSYTLSNAQYLRHHDIAPLPNGNVLMIAWDARTAEEAIAAGRNPSTITGGAFWGEAILEVRPIRPSGGEIVWEWHSWDHLVQDFDSNKRNYGDVAAHPERMDINFGRQTPDWLHFNAIAYNPILDQIIVSSRTLSEIWIIDHSTTSAQAAGHSGGRSGKGGDILYRWGNPQTYRSGNAGDQRLFDQHGVHWIEPGLPGAGHILVFNNGGARNFSTVDEIKPPVEETGAYARTPGSAFGPNRALWSYGADARPRFLSRTFGGVQRLPNGNTLICVSNANLITEVTPESEVVWQADITGLAAAGGGGTFRATRFPVNFQGLLGTDLFREAPTLVNAASLLAGPSAASALAVALGEGLASSTAVANSGTLPIVLAGTSVDLIDGAGTRFSAPLLSVSPARITFQIPPGAAVGPARATFRVSGGSEQSADLRIDPVAPALFSANADGKGVGALLAVRVNRSGQSVEPVFTFDQTASRFAAKPLSLGNRYEQVYLVLFGTGIRGVPEKSSVSVSIAGRQVPVIAVAAQGEFEGLDQVNVGPLPVSLSGLGEQPILLSIDGKAANVVSVSFQ